MKLNFAIICAAPCRARCCLVCDPEPRFQGRRPWRCWWHRPGWKKDFFLTTNYCHVTWFLQPLSLLLKLNPRVTELTCYDVSPVTPGNIITFRFLGSHFNDWGHRCCCGSQPLLEQQQGHWLHWRGFAESPRWMPGNTSLSHIVEVVLRLIDSKTSSLPIASVFSVYIFACVPSTSKTF